MEQKQPPKEEANIDLTVEQTQSLIDIIKKHFIIEDVLYRIRPELKTSYQTRSEKYPELLNDPNIIIKLPVDKMNEEERFLYAYLSLPNLVNDLPSLLSYLNLLMSRLGNPSDKTTIDSILNIGIANFYASKLKLYSADADDSETEEDREREKKMLENREPLSEEEAKKELEELQSYPLFMTEMPEHPEENEKLQALQALKYEGDADVVAMEFYERAKKCFDDYLKKKQFKDLREAMYTICNAIDHVNGDTKADHVKFELFYLRSKMQVLVKNWGYAVNDLKDAIKYIPYIKTPNLDIDDAYLKLIYSYMQLEQFEKAKSVLSQRVNEIKDKPDIKKKYDKYAEDISRTEQKILDDLSKMETFKNLKGEKQLVLYNALTSRGIRLKKQIHNIPAGVESEIYIDEDNKCHFPILIIYEEFNMTDYIQDFCEDSLIGDLLEMIFEGGKLPWDSEGKYAKSNAICYYQCSNFDEVTKYENVLYYQLRNDETLMDALLNKKLHMNGFPIVSIVSPMSQNFYEHFLKTKIILKRKTDKKRHMQK